MDLEARLLINGRVHEVRDFVCYFPECVLVIKTRRFQGERPKELRVNFSFAARQATGVRYRSRESGGSNAICQR
jgi:hypothetical protein